MFEKLTYWRELGGGKAESLVSLTAGPITDALDRGTYKQQTFTSQLWKPQPESKPPADLVSGEGLVLVHSQHLLTVPSGQKGHGCSVGPLQGPRSHSWGPTFMNKSPPIGPIPYCHHIGGEVSIREFWGDTNIQSIAPLEYCM